MKKIRMRTSRPEKFERKIQHRDMKKVPLARQLAIVIRGEKPEFHKAPFHPVIIVSRKHVMEWESEGTENGATVLINLGCADTGYSWLVHRYKGYVLDGNGYFDLFDGANTKDISTFEYVSKELLPKAVWWSYDRMPEWLLEYGVKHVEDDFSKEMILQDSGLCLLPYSKAEKIQAKLNEYEEPEWLKLSNQ